MAHAVAKISINQPHKVNLSGLVIADGVSSEQACTLFANQKCLPKAFENLGISEDYANEHLKMDSDSPGVKGYRLPSNRISQSSYYLPASEINVLVGIGEKRWNIPTIVLSSRNDFTIPSDDKYFFGYHLSAKGVTGTTVKSYSSGYRHQPWSEGRYVIVRLIEKVIENKPVTY
jgi:hypothetical protein